MGQWLTHSRPFIYSLKMLGSTSSLFSFQITAVCHQKPNEDNVYFTQISQSLLSKAERLTCASSPSFPVHSPVDSPSPSSEKRSILLTAHMRGQPSGALLFNLSQHYAVMLISETLKTKPNKQHYFSVNVWLPAEYLKFLYVAILIV